MVVNLFRYTLLKSNYGVLFLVFLMLLCTLPLASKKRVSINKLTTTTFSADAQAPFQLPLPRSLKVTILNTQPFHDEVFAAIVKLFGSVTPVAQISLYLKRQRWDIESIIESLRRHDRSTLDARSLTEWTASSESSDILVLTTCEHDLHPNYGALGPRLYELPSSVHIVCVAHNTAPDIAVADPIIRKLVEQGRFTFLGLVKHAAVKVRQKMSGLNQIYNFAEWEFWPPVFAVDYESEPDPCLFAIQGNLESARRDFAGTLASFEQQYIKFRSEVDQICNIRLNIIGTTAGGGHVEIPAVLRDRVTYHDGLSYPEFYKLIGKSMAVVPAFATNLYLTDKATSTVPAALIAGAPLVVGSGILDKYRYLDADAHYVRSDNETEMESLFGHIMRLGKQGIQREVSKKRIAIRKNRDHIIQRNAVLGLSIVHRVCRTCF